MEWKMEWNSEHTQLQLTCVTGAAYTPMVVVGSWVPGAGWRSVGRRRLYAGFFNTTTPSPPVAAVGDWGLHHTLGFFPWGYYHQEVFLLKRILLVHICNPGLQNWPLCVCEILKLILPPS